MRARREASPEEAPTTTAPETAAEATETEGVRLTHQATDPEGIRSSPQATKKATEEVVPAPGPYTSEEKASVRLVGGLHEDWSKEVSVLLCFCCCLSLSSGARQRSRWE